MAFVAGPLSNKDPSIPENHSSQNADWDSVCSWHLAGLFRLT